MLEQHGLAAGLWCGPQPTRLHPRHPAGQLPAAVRDHSCSCSSCAGGQQPEGRLQDPEVVQQLRPAGSPLAQAEAAPAIVTRWVLYCM